jgi:hypothetical protein
MNSLAAVNLALVAAWAIAFRRRQAPRGMQRLWSDFRDGYGLVWGVRVVERLNVAARRQGWPVEFTWSGIRVKEPDEADNGGRRAGRPAAAGPGKPTANDDPLERLDPAVRRRIRRELRALLRRFVSAEWIAERDLPNTAEPAVRRSVSAAAAGDDGATEGR